jgi:hypothetical protein
VDPVSKPKIFSNINLNLLRYSNSKLIPLVIQIHGKKMFVHARAA